MFFAQCKFQTKKGEDSALQNPGDICQRCYAVLTHPFQSPAGAVTLGSPQPQLSSSPAQLFLGRALLVPVYHVNGKLCHRRCAGPRRAAMSWASSGNPRLSPALFFSCPWVSSPTYLGSELPKAEAPLPSTQSALYRGTARKNDGGGEGASASLVRKNTAYFPLKKKKPNMKGF